jgi:hypothetical protein
MVIGLALAAAALAEAAGSHVLDKRVFSGNLEEAGSGKSDRDDLRFEHGTFTSSASKRLGFSPAPYTATEKDGVVSFTASAKNGSGETMEWAGTVTGNDLEATAVHGDKTYHYKGAAVKAKDETKQPEHPEHPR